MKIKRLAKRLFSGLLLLMSGAVFADNHEFSIVVLPDTQLYAESYPAIIEAQMQWIVDNQAAENIIYVAQLGDLKDDLACDNKRIAAAVGGDRTEWEIVDQAFGLLETATSAAQPDGIPFGTVAGNHDFEPVGGACPTDWDDPAQRILDNATTGLAYNNLFGPARFAGRAYYGGSRIGGSNEDNFTLFESNGVKFIAINLGYREGQNLPVPPPGDDSPEQTWANNLLQTYPDRLGIITSHYFMRCNIVTGAPGASSCNSTGSQNSIGSYGTQVYTRLQGNPNLFMMLGAHKRGEAYRLETRSGMQPVHVMLANYQSMLYPGGDPTQAATFQNLQPANFGYGDSGFMRIMRFDVDTGTVDIETFSPPVPATPAVTGTVPAATCQSGGYQAGDICSTPAISARSFLPSVFTPANPGANNVLHTGTASNMTGISFTGYIDDTTPDPFNFTDQAGVALNTAITSNAITVSGIDAAADISVIGGQYSIDGGAFTSAAGTVNSGQSVRIRVTSSSSNLITTSATLTIGGVSDTFSVVTVAVPGTVDSDNDFIEDHFDNCPFVANGPTESFCATGNDGGQCSSEYQFGLIDRRKQSYIDCLINQGVPAQDANMGIEAGVCTFQLFSDLLLDSYDDACGGSPCNGIQEDSDGDGIGNACE